MIIFAHMKLMFSIRYKAPFGQSMHVVVTYMDRDGRARESNLLMRTEDGVLWTTETTGPMPRHAAPVHSIAYVYRVEDDKGKVMRTEWAAVPRLYCLDSTRTYVFHDIWRDLSLQHYLFPPRTDRPPVPADSMPCYNRSVIFRVAAPHVPDGCEVAVVGSEPSLGVWNTMRYLPMRYIGSGDWMLTINAYAMTLPFEYKYVVVDSHTHDIVEWEEGDNRRTPVSRLEDGEQLVVYGGNIRTQCALTFHDELLDKKTTVKYGIRELYI